ncbi:MAG: hypothetical protein LJE67_14160 [Salaquimonas sp.]|nr:hypothetical protein [Salaquimonas sp.]
MTRSFTRHGFRFRVAGPEHDKAIADLLNANAVAGWISLAYRTEPGWHHPLRPDARSETVIGTRLEDGQAGGIATRSVLPSFVNGQARPVGWLGQLRVDPQFRNRAHLLRAGFEAVRTFLHDPAETPWYLASIIEGNDTARRILEAGLDGFPLFEPLFAYEVLAMTAPARTTFPATIRRAEPGDMTVIGEFLDEQNRSRDFAPHIGNSSGLSEWTDLAPSDFLVREEGGRIGGVAAVWDQAPYRSLVATAYRPPLDRLRPLVNLAAPLAGLPRLPAPGRPLGQAYLALPAVRGDDEAVWIDLVTAALVLTREKGLQLLAAGFAHDDPLRVVTARRFRHRTYRSTIYGVRWGEDGECLDPAKIAMPKIEIGLL